MGRGQGQAKCAAAEGEGPECRVRSPGEPGLRLSGLVGVFSQAFEALLLSSLSQAGRALLRPIMRHSLEQARKLSGRVAESHTLPFGFTRQLSWQVTDSWPDNSLSGRKSEEGDGKAPSFQESLLSESPPLGAFL